jgi:hypothetical protein
MRPGVEFPRKAREERQFPWRTEAKIRDRMQCQHSEDVTLFTISAPLRLGLSLTFELLGRNRASEDLRVPISDF